MHCRTFNLASGMFSMIESVQTRVIRCRRWDIIIPISWLLGCRVFSLREIKTEEMLSLFQETSRRRLPNLDRAKKNFQ